MRGDFCHTCGQKDDDYRRPLLTLSNEFLGDVFQWDSRVIRSVLPFLIMPGTLTRAYMRGRRQQFISPLRLYLVISVVFFLVLTSSDRAIFGFTYARNLAEDFPELAGELANVEPQYLGYGETVELAMFVDPETMTAVPRIPVERIEGVLGNTSVATGLLPLLVGYNEAVEDPRIFNGVLHKWVPGLMVVLVPFFALILGALYVRRRVWFIDHLVFSLHFHSFMFAVLLLMLGISWGFGVSFKGLGAAAFFFAIMGLYLYIAMLRVYRNGVFKTAIKFMILGSVYVNVFVVSLFFITAYGLSQL